MGVDVISHSLLQTCPRISARQGSLYGIQTPDRDSCLGLYSMSDLVLLSEYDFDQDTFIALWNNCTFEEDHRKHHTSDCLGLKW